MYDSMRRLTGRDSGVRRPWPRRLLEAAVLALVVSLAGPWLGAPWQRFDRPATAEGASAFTCTLVIGYSVSQQWFESTDTGASAFESIVGSDTWELLWQGGGSARYWASPDYAGWRNGLGSPCTRNATTPDRLLLDITRDEYVTDPQVVVADIRGEIAAARQKYPSVRQIILQPIVGGPSHQVCPRPGAPQNAVRASYNHAAIDAAIDAVVGGDVVRGADPLVGSCADYADDVGHLTGAGAVAAARYLGNFYVQLDGSSPVPPPPTATARTATVTPTTTPPSPPALTPTSTPDRGIGGSVSTTLTFDDLPGQNRAFTGQYPAGLIDWGTGGTWWLSAPWRAFTTKSISFSSGSGPATQSFTFLAPVTLTSMEAFNGGATPATIALACDGQTTATSNVPPGQTVLITTGWTGRCGAVRLSASNGWNTNFDNLVVTALSTATPTTTSLPALTATRTPAPALTPTRTPVPPALTPTPAPDRGIGGSAPTTLTFDDLPGQDRAFTGQYPAGVVDWGTGQWYHSRPWGLFTTKSISFVTGGRTSATFTFLTPRRLVSVRAYNGGRGASTVTLACAGLPTRTQSVPAGQVATLTTDWSGTCATVTVGSSNGWDTNFDDLVHSG